MTLADSHHTCLANYKENTNALSALLTLCEGNPLITGNFGGYLMDFEYTQVNFVFKKARFFCPDVIELVHQIRED